MTIVANWIPFKGVKIFQPEEEEEEGERKKEEEKIFFESLLCLNFILSLGSDRSENIDESKIVFKLSENSKSVEMKKKKLNLSPFQIQIEARQ